MRLVTWPCELALITVYPVGFPIMRIQVLTWNMRTVLQHPHTNSSNLDHCAIGLIKSIRHWSLGKAWIWYIIRLESFDALFVYIVSTFCDHCLFDIPIMINRRQLISCATTHHIFPNWFERDASTDKEITNRLKLPCFHSEILSKLYIEYVLQ